jgi:hypothetical protein
MTPYGVRSTTLRIRSRSEAPSGCGDTDTTYKNRRAAWVSNYSLRTPYGYVITSYESGGKVYDLGPGRRGRGGLTYVGPLAGHAFRTRVK